MQFGNSIPSGNEQCYLCGVQCAKEYTVAKSIPDTFNSHYLAKAPSSSFVCHACWWFFNDKSHTEFRKMSLVVRQDMWQNWPRDAMKADITRWLTDGLENDSYLVVSLSKKKHVLLQAPMNAMGTRMLAIQVEEQVAHVRLEDWQHIDNAFMALLRLGHGKGEILSGDLYGQTLRKHGRLTEAMMYSEQIESWRKSPQIELLSYVTIYERGQDLDGSEDKRGGITDQLRAGTGDKTDSVNPAQSHVVRNRQRVPEQISHGDLENVRGKGSGVGADYEQLSLFSE